MYDSRIDVRTTELHILNLSTKPYLSPKNGNGTFAKVLKYLKANILEEKSASCCRQHLTSGSKPF